MLILNLHIGDSVIIGPAPQPLPAEVDASGVLHRFAYRIANDALGARRKLPHPISGLQITLAEISKQDIRTIVAPYPAGEHKASEVRLAVDVELEIRSIQTTVLFLSDVHRHHSARMGIVAPPEIAIVRGSLMGLGRLAAGRLDEVRCGLAMARLHLLEDEFDLRDQQQNCRDAVANANLDSKLNTKH